MIWTVVAKLLFIAHNKVQIYQKRSSGTFRLESLGWSKPENRLFPDDHPKFSLYGWLIQSVRHRLLFSTHLLKKLPQFQRSQVCANQVDRRYSTFSRFSLSFIAAISRDRNPSEWIILLSLDNENEIDSISILLWFELRAFLSILRFSLPLRFRSMIAEFWLLNTVPSSLEWHGCWIRLKTNPINKMPAM